MTSVVLYSDDYDRAIDQGSLDPLAFDYRFLCEGDSWMDRSSLFQLSLPWALAKSFQGSKGNRALFINLARFGDTMRSIADCADGLFRQWLDTDGLPFQFDALLFSASGNDFIDAALEPGSGNGILNGVQGAPPGLTADDCYNHHAVEDLVGKTIDPKFAEIYQLVRSSRRPDLPILLTCYSLPVARFAPAFPGGKPWLSRAYQKNGIPQRLWPEVTERIFIDEDSLGDLRPEALRNAVLLIRTREPRLAAGKGGREARYRQAIASEQNRQVRAATGADQLVNLGELGVDRLSHQVFNGMVVVAVVRRQTR